MIAIRTQLEQALRAGSHAGLRQTEWDLLVEKRWVADAEISGEIRDLVVEVMGWRRASGGQATRSRSAPTEAISLSGSIGGARAEALAEVFATDAANDPEVIEFRERTLEVLLAPEDVAQWMEEHEVRDVEQRSAEPCSYVIPGSEWVQWAATVAGGVLDELRFLGERLASIYGWHEARATTFVLTGQPPEVAGLRIGREVRTHVDVDGRPISAASRLILDVDPTISAEELSTALKRIQRDMLRGSRPGAKASLLAAFAYSHPEGTWRERMEAWDRLHADPKWRYGGKAGDTNNFQRDVTKYLPRLLDPVGSPRRQSSAPRSIPGSRA